MCLQKTFTRNTNALIYIAPGKHTYITRIYNYFGFCFIIYKDLVYVHICICIQFGDGNCLSKPIIFYILFFALLHCSVVFSCLC